MTPEKVLDWMERLQPALLRFLRGFGYQYDAEDALHRVRLKLIGLREDGPEADPPPCTKYQGDPEDREKVFRWLCSWAKNEARNVRSRALARRESSFVEERTPGTSRKRAGVEEALEAIAEEEGSTPPDEKPSTPAPRIPAEQLRACMERYKELETARDTPTDPGPDAAIEDDQDVWTLLTDVELDLNTGDAPAGPRPRGRPHKWDDTNKRRIFADVLHVRRALRHARKEFARGADEPESSYQKRLATLVLEFDQWLRERGPISYRARPDATEMATPGRTFPYRLLIPVWPPLAWADACRIARRSEGHETALTIELVANYYGARPGQIRGVLAWARKLAVSLVPSLARDPRQKSA